MRYVTLFSGAIAALSSFGGAQAGGYREFGKWAVGCDNALVCAAYGISDKDLAGERWGLRINRAPGYDGKIALRFNGNELSGENTIIIDGKTAVFEPSPSGQANALPQERLLQVVSRLLNAATMTLPGEEKGGEIVALGGLKAALLFMDEQQGRIEALNAFVAKGEKKTATPPQSYPIIKAAKVPKSTSTAGIDLDAKAANLVMAYYRKNADRKMCDLGMERGSEEKPSAYALHKGLTLIEVSCWRAAYQAGSVYYLYDVKNGVVRDAPFEIFDLKTGTIKIGKNASVSGADFADGAIASLHKGRGVGGCGEAISWQWDGKVFRLTSHAYKSLCNHSDAAFRLYRSQIREPDGKLSSLNDESDEDITF